MMYHEEEPMKKESVRSDNDNSRKESTNTYVKESISVTEKYNYPLPEQEIIEEKQTGNLNPEDCMLDYPTAQEDEFQKLSMDSFMILSELKKQSNK